MSMFDVVFDTQEKMDELVLIDPDFPFVKRWIMAAILNPDRADELASTYGSKDEWKKLDELLKQELSIGETLKKFGGKRYQ